MIINNYGARLANGSAIRDTTPEYLRERRNGASSSQAPLSMYIVTTLYTYLLTIITIHHYLNIEKTLFFLLFCFLFFLSAEGGESLKMSFNEMRDESTQERK